MQEAVGDEVESSESTMNPSTSVQSLATLIKQNQKGVLSPFISPACSMEFLTEIDKKPFREQLLMALPMLIHPVIILRLLAHKLFGNMIRRKSSHGTLETKLRPPENPMEEVCPPRCNSESIKYELKKDIMKKKRNLKISITNNKNSSSDEMESPNVSSPGDYVKYNGVQSKNKPTQLALKAMGQSLANPTQSNSSGQINQVCESSSGNAISSPESFSENKHEKNSGNHANRSKLFHWSSKKHLCKSQSSMSAPQSENNNDSMDLGSEGSLNSTSADVDIVAFQRELINLPTFVMDTPATDVSPIFSRSSSVPENLARTGGNDPSPTELSSCSSEHLNNQKRSAEVFPDTSKVKVPNSPSVITITTTDWTNCPRQQDIGFQPGESSTDSTNSDSKVANIEVHFEAPASPMSSASQSPQIFEFPSPFDSSKPNNGPPATSVSDKQSLLCITTCVATSAIFLIPSPTTSIASSTTNTSVASPWSPSTHHTNNVNMQVPTLH